MKHILATIAFIIIANHCNPQQLNYNFYVDTLEADVKRAIHFYQEYLDEFSKDSLPDFKKYWSAKDCSNYKCPDQMIYAISSDYPTYKMKCKRTVLYIKPTSGYINIKTLFAFVDSFKNVSPLCITNHYIKFDNLKPYFVNPVEINAKTWHTKTLRNITFVYPPYHKFNQKKADSLISKVKKLEKDWSLEPITIHYYFADTKYELQKLKGFDYTCDMGNRDKASGISDDRNNLVYCGGWGENYFHEVVHIYLNHQYPKSPLKEGLAIFYGGSLGHELPWHLKRLKEYLNQHPEINLNKWDDLGYIYMDNYTNFNSTILGLLCETAFRKDGIKGLKQIMSYQSLDEIFKKEFNTLPGNGNTFIRQLINKQ